VVPSDFGDIYDVSRGGPGGDPERSRSEATRRLQAIADGKLNPLSVIDELDMLEDAAYDFGVDLGVIHEAHEASAFVFRDAEPRASVDRRADLRVAPAIREARRLYISNDARPIALRSAYTAVFELNRLAGGESEVLRALRSEVPNSIAKNAVFAGAILACAAKRAATSSTLTGGDRITPKLLRSIMDFERRLIGAYLLSGHEQVPYPRSFSFSAQNLYFFCAHGGADDRVLVDVLWNDDEMRRPKDARGQASRPLRDHAYCSFVGLRDEAAEHARVAPAALVELRLLRALRRVSEEDYLHLRG
jgi:hypothetical protein